MTAPMTSVAKVAWLMPPGAQSIMEPDMSLAPARIWPLVKPR